MVEALPPVVFAIPGDLATPTGGYIYDRNVLARLPGLGVPVRHLALPDGFPFPLRSELVATHQAFDAEPADALLLIDGLAYGAFPPALLDKIHQPIVALVHHPLGYETGIPPDRAAVMIANERAALSRARHVIVSSPLTARTLAAEFAVPAEKITVAEPGTEPAARAAGSGGPAVHLIAVGAVSPRKGYDVLIDALAPLAALPWRLTIAGATDRMPEEVADLRDQIAQLGLGDRVRLAGNLEPGELRRLYAEADGFVLSSYYEGYGMALAEALACGLPIVTTTGGAAAETVPDAAALKVPPGDVAALGAAVARLFGEPALRGRLADSAWAAGQMLPRWDDTARTIANVLKRMAG